MRDFSFFFATLVVVLCLALAPAPALANHVLGSVTLDSLSFNKTVRNFPHTLVKFDTAYPDGDRHQAYVDLAEQLAEVDDILIAEVRFRTTGNKINEALARRFQLTDKNTWPEVILFKQGKEEYTRFGGSFTTSGLKDFLGHKTGVAIAMPGCLKQFDDLAELFAKKTDDKDRKMVALSAEKMAEQLKEPRDRQRADKYVKLMKLIMEKGDKFVRKESKRVKKLLRGQLTPEKKREFERWLNVIWSFRKFMDEPLPKKNEL